MLALSSMECVLYADNRRFMKDIDITPLVFNQSDHGRQVRHSLHEPH